MAMADSTPEYYELLLVEDSHMGNTHLTDMCYGDWQLFMGKERFGGTGIFWSTINYRVKNNILRTISLYQIDTFRNKEVILKLNSRI